MKSFITSLLLLVLMNTIIQGMSQCENDTIPPGFPDITSTFTEDAAPGYIYFTTAFNPYRLVILDQSAIPVYFNDQIQGTYSNFRYQNDNLYTFADQTNAAFVGMDSNYNFVDTFKMGPGHQADFHDIHFTPSGNVILMSYDTKEIDMSQIVPGGNPSASVKGLVLQELDQEDNVIFEWRSWDHFEITDGLTVGFNPIDFTSSSFSYVHCNSIDIDHDGNWIISSRHMSEVTKINRQTGEIIWRMGGLNNEFIFINDPFNGFTDQHDAQRLNNGNIMIFDNGLNHESPTTRVIEYDIDEVNKVATLVWSYENPNGHLTQISGNAQRLENGNTFISWGRRTGVVPAPTDLAVEVDQDGNTVFELFFNQPGQVGFIYRIFKLPWNDPTLTTGISQFVKLQANVKTLPNPVNEIALFQIDGIKTGDYRFTVLDMLGRTMTDQKLNIISSHTHTLEFDTSDLPVGPYYYILSHSRKMISGKFLVKH